jgi:hypothetical protein
MSIPIVGEKSKMTKPEDKLGIGDKLVDRKFDEEEGLKLVGTFDKSKVARYQKAIEKKAILMDQEDDEGIDYTHFDFVLSTGCGFYSGMSNLQALKLFWKAQYPYFKNIIVQYEEFYDRFRVMIDDQEEVLRNHAELDFKYKWTREFIKSSGMSKKYNAFIEQQIAEIKKEYKGRDKEMPSSELPDLID